MINFVRLRIKKTQLAVFAASLSAGIFCSGNYLIAQNLPNSVYILLYNSGTAEEGIHTIQVHNTHTILMFESSASAKIFAEKLRLQNFSTPQIESVTAGEVTDFCQENGYICKLIPTGTKIEPPITKREILPG
ncbi:MAG: DUF3110 domain-containing protein [Cyanobacteria bacterium P01_G01_bin.39]